MGIAVRFTYTLAAALVTQSASAQAPASQPAPCSACRTARRRSQRSRPGCSR